MKKFIIFIVVLLILGAGYYYLAPKTNVGTDLTNSITNNVTNVVTDTSKVSTPTESTPGEVSVDIKNFSFSPNALNVKVGTKVTWTNRDSVAHTVTSDTGSLLNSPSLAQGESFSFTFISAGSAKYHCGPHPRMQAVVNVTE